MGRICQVVSTSLSRRHLLSPCHLTALEREGSERGCDRRVDVGGRLANFNRALPKNPVQQLPINCRNLHRSVKGDVEIIKQAVINTVNPAMDLKKLATLPCVLNDTGVADVIDLLNNVHLA